MNIEIIFEDQDLVVINKPAGVVVNRAQTVKGQTIQDWMEERLDWQEVENKAEWQDLVPADFDDSYGSPLETFQERVGLVHRLDKDTSGAMILAKNPGVLVNLLAQFKNRQVQKQYQCLAHGKFKFPEGEVNAPMGRASRDRKVFAVRAEGRPAVTKYKVVEEFTKLNFDQLAKSNPTLDSKELSNLSKKSHIYQGFSLVNCWPKTGRTHQIRVHMHHLQHPLVGDITYVGKKRAKLDPVWCPRQFLHASKLELAHPRSGEKVEFEAKLAGDLKKVLSYFE